MKVAFFTPRSIRPLHPRLVSFEAYFKKRCIEVEFINASDYAPNLMSRINWICFWFFDLYAINRCKPFVKNFDIVFINDMKYLPLARYAKRLNKVVLYDTIDHNVYLRFYQLEQKIKIVHPFKSIITSIFKKLEYHFAFRYCDEILVNSSSLQRYFHNKAHVLFYSSPFEKIQEVNASTKPMALLYLGIFSPEKGAREIIALQKKLNLPIFIYGDVSEPVLLQEIKELKDVSYTSKLSVSDLEQELKKLLLDYYLVGFSLIKPAHYSYEVQEANKDIDYLALGIPLIGNYRLPTKEKIDAGCGLFFDDTHLPEKLKDSKTRERLTQTSKIYYQQHYANHLFADAMEKIMSTYLPKGI
ncbi:MAG: hypothetical protein ABI663_09915 [Chryseolinea sp.]